MKDREIINILRTLLKARIKAKGIKCTCSSFILQYEGCSCGVRTSIQSIDNAIWDALDNIIL